MQPTMAAGKQLNFRLEKEEIERFERVAAHYGISVAAMLRMLVKREDDAIASSTLDDTVHEDVLHVIETLALSGLATETEVITEATKRRPGRRPRVTLGALIDLTLDGSVEKRVDATSQITHYVYTSKLTAANLRHEARKQGVKL